MKKVSSVRTVIISINEIEQRIDNFLHTKFKNIPKSTIYRLLRRGEIRVNKKRVKPKYKLTIGDKVRIPPTLQTTENKKKIISPSLYFQKLSMISNMILYEDEYILALNKLSGVAVHGGSKLNFGIIEGLRGIRPKECFLELVHRLDRDTSGVLLIAKKRSALRLLHEQLRKNWMQKDYLALVYGQWKSHIKKVQAPLLKKIIKSGERIVQVNENGKPSETLFKIEEIYEFSTLLRCVPITGRTHQIRVHTRYIGHPIAFDNRYGRSEFDNQLKFTGLSRLFLHAVTLKFIHPNTKKIVLIEAPLDEQLKHCLEFLRK